MQFVFEKCKFILSWFCYLLHGEGDWKGATCAFLLLIGEKSASAPGSKLPIVTGLNTLLFREEISR